MIHAFKNLSTKKIINNVFLPLFITFSDYNDKSTLLLYSFVSLFMRKLQLRNILNQITWLIHCVTLYLNGDMVNFILLT